ncbi:GerAB/ArcD/ProY family transporter [Bacillus sp. FJAT-49736]|uniref:GerAB/ArcD/ProY family transporter n=1 Tax=Bacillus sp. FJAT-49736 TaxID=2833582 RepID=UPI001BC9C80B|nr:GerAB/ArcD/ProY family transporter [Bacillus sp. FJAT-49736]MBS4175143.1 GerAB/ArcD/ProY family transporter [Bacillus sp. FJAT-49736]
MNRFFYYLIIVNMITNVLTFIPRILLNERLTGGLLAIPIGTIVGMGLMYFFIKQISKFPGMGLPEILEKYLPKWFKNIYIFFNGFMWFYAGIFTLLSLITITKVFISPDMSGFLITGMFLLLLCFYILMPSKKVLYATELIIILNTPFILLILIKAIFNEYFSWDAVRIFLTHYRELPSWSAISAATFIYFGFANLIIFNREFQKINLKWLWLIILFGLQVLLVTTFGPIGFHGAVRGVEAYVFPWVSTADSMRMELGFVERVLFIFLLLHLNISLVSILIHWHVSLQLFKSIFPKFKVKGKNIISYVISAFFAIMTFIIDALTSENNHFDIMKTWINGLIPAALFMNIVLLWTIRRKKKYE